MSLLASCSHLREQAAGRASQAQPSTLRRSARLAPAQAEAHERKNAQERGELFGLVEVTNTITGLIELTKAYLSRVGAVVAKGDAALRQRIDQAVNDALIDLSDVEVVDMNAVRLGAVIKPDE
ncbi:hypothetical protein [Sphingomonas sp. CFBP 8764]|uniref:hypothetical protein n=1 Tax=Sphingomonas sp. CFBP 8764 TaxID=2775275 RepID=UPI0017838BA4|nr:hypothetical protein [Sphingomonas sp. CFBP 8764]MBD8552368.1 hypothetical protein [Sphingomonas sp. CFBP 8764]